MKRFICLILSIMCLFCIGCSNIKKDVTEYTEEDIFYKLDMIHGNIEIEKTNSVGTITKKCFKGFTEENTYSLYDKIITQTGFSYTISTKSDGKDTIDTKVVTLKQYENLFYLTVFRNDVYTNDLFDKTVIRQYIIVIYRV